MNTALTQLFIGSVIFASWYLWKRIKIGISVSALVMGCLIVFHGPAYLDYYWHFGPGTLIYEACVEGQRDAVYEKVTAALIITFFGTIIGMELANLQFPGFSTKAINSQKNWGQLPLIRLYTMNGPLLILSIISLLLMLFMIVWDDMTGKVLIYLANGGDEHSKIWIRKQLGGSNFYLYNIIMYSIAPFLAIVLFQIWRGKKDFPLLLMLIALLIAIFIGKLATLSKAPAVMFVLQIAIFLVLTKRGTVNWRNIVYLSAFCFCLFVAVSLIAIPNQDVWGILDFLYYRTFMISNEGLVEYFSAIPTLLPHGWGTGIGLIAAISGNTDYLPSYSAVAAITRHSLDSTTTAMFVADAWAEFSWFGVVGFTIFVGYLSRCIDLYCLRNGRSDEAAAVTAGVFYGVFTLFSTSLPTALLSGGLAVIPLMSYQMIKQSRYPNNQAYSL